MPSTSEQEKSEGLRYLKDYLNAHIGHGARRYYTQMPNGYQYMNSSAYNPYDTPQTVEESVDISMRHSDFQELARLIGIYRMHGYNSDHLRDIERRLVAEYAVRKQYPAVQQAYENYQMMFKMAASGEEIPE